VDGTQIVAAWLLIVRQPAGSWLGWEIFNAWPLLLKFSFSKRNNVNFSLSWSIKWHNFNVSCLPAPAHKSRGKVNSSHLNVCQLQVLVVLLIAVPFTRYVQLELLRLAYHASLYPIAFLSGTVERRLVSCLHSTSIPCHMPVAGTVIVKVELTEWISFQNGTHLFNAMLTSSGEGLWASFWLRFR